MNYWKSPTKHYMLIGGIVLALYLFFALVFRIEESPGKQTKVAADSNLFHMIPGAESQDAYFREQTARAELDDPTLMSFPNVKYGFSLIRFPAQEPDKPVLPVYEQEFIEIPLPEEERLPLVGIYPDPDKDPGTALPTPQIQEIDIPDTKERFSKRVVWIEDGREVACPFKVEDILEILEKKTPSEVTEVNIIQITDSYTTQLVKKCGVPELDKMVLEEFRKRIFDLFMQGQEKEELPKKVIIDWRMLQ